LKAVLQRVSRARVTAEGRVLGEISRGLVILLGVAQGDGEADARLLATKTANLRIFADAQRSSICLSWKWAERPWS